MSQNVNSASSATEKKIGYSNQAELLGELKHYMNTNSTMKDNAANYLFHSLVDDMILGVVLEIHHAWRIGLISNEPENCIPYSEENAAKFNVFDKVLPSKKASKSCICTKCNRSVATLKFVTHLEVCMKGLPPRQASRLANQKIATTGDSDNDDDIEVSEKRRRRNNANVRSNGKRNRKT